MQARAGERSEHILFLVLSYGSEIQQNPIFGNSGDDRGLVSP